jgi:hypothetical protein
VAPVEQTIGGNLPKPRKLTPIISMTVLLQVLVSCVFSQDVGISLHQTAVEDRHTEEYAVYGEFLERVNREVLPLSGGVHHVFAVADTMARMPWASFTDDRSGDLLTETFAHMNLPAGLTDSFYAANATQLCLQAERFRSRHPVVLIERDADGCMKPVGVPRDSAAAPLVTGFSRVGFSDDRGQALMVVETDCGPRCGWVSAVHLELVAGHWTVLHSRQVILF